MPAPKCVADYHELQHLDPHLFASLDSCYVFIAGSPDPTNSGLQGFFVWRRESSDAADGGTVIESHALSAPSKGRWHRVFDGPISVKWFGAKGDTKEVADGGAIMMGTTTLTVNTAGFLSSDVGKSITTAGAGVAGALLVTTIAAVVSSTQVTLTVPASTSVSATHVSWGTDDSTAIQAAMKAVLSSRGTLFFPVGTYQLSNNIEFPTNISTAFDNGAMLAPVSGVTVT